MYSKEFGEIKVTLSKRSRHIRLNVRPFRGLEISAPKYASHRDIETVINKKAEWIRTQLSKIEAVQKKRTIFTPETNFETKRHRLTVIPSEIDKPRSRIKNGIIKVEYPGSMDTEDEKLQSEVRKAIEKAFRIEADEYIPYRVRGLSNKHSLKFNKVCLKNITTRWGSCSHKNNLNFNIHLMRLPDDLIDYVLLHELAHTVVKNHSPKFWALLDTLLPDGKLSKKTDKELNTFKIGVW
ncbi:MAG: SprT family zinc-dependent metalloprotease [Pseudomonadota bacterium]